jgi:putative SOS response-associated peptidase YedK
MCYSAQVAQDIKTLMRAFFAFADYEQMEQVFLERLTSKSIRILRGFEANFAEPRSTAERRIKDLIDQYRATRITELEQEVFRQKKRLADAERKLKLKETRTALEERRIATTRIETSLEKLSLLKGTQPHEDDDRVFPMSYAPIIVNRGGQNAVVLARYHLRQKGKPASVYRQFPGLYNARRDNLERFWRDEFGRAHALMVVDSFYENVEREGRNVVLHFTPKPAHQMLVACLYSEWSDPKEGKLLSFAAITDEPPDEIKAAGHDRCVINLREENVGAWLAPAGRSDEQLQAILSDRQKPYYEHEVMAA